MKTCMLRGSWKLWLFAAAVVVSMLAVAQDHSPASATTTTEILPALSSVSPNWTQTVLLIKGGHTSSLSACDPLNTDRATACLYIWAKNVDASSTGASSFEVKGKYDNTKMGVTSITSSATWLNRTGRATFCLPGVITVDPATQAGRAYTSCNTLNPPPPYGPKCPTYCSGVLATIGVESKNVLGVTTLDFSQDTFLLDTPSNIDNATQIPTVIDSLNVSVVPCADMTNDGVVLIGDISYLISRYRSTGGPPASPNWDPHADLNGDNKILINDITIAITEYRAHCTK